MDPAVSRAMWKAAEPLHAVTYFAPQAREAWEAAGLRGFWRGYFATRAAPLGAAGPDLVTALFYNFAPAMVRRAVPEVWTLVTPGEAWAARLAGVDRALRAVLGEDVVADCREPAALVRAALAACRLEGRALGAAHLAVPWPDEPHLALWHGLTVLRELRGDVHNAALLAAGIDGCAAHVLADAIGTTPRDLTQPNRGWSDDDWASATDGLRGRGLVDLAGRATVAGRALHGEVEAGTDRRSGAPWQSLGEAPTERLHLALTALSGRVVAAGVVPVPNPMGAPWP